MRPAIKSSLISASIDFFGLDGVVGVVMIKPPCICNQLTAPSDEDYLSLINLGSIVY